MAILLECEEEMCVSRLLLRGQESDRIDDNEVAIRRRIEFFKTNTMPVVQQLQKEGKLVSVSELNQIVNAECYVPWAQICLTILLDCNLLSFL